MPTRTPHIQDVELPEIGKTYWVPHVKVREDIKLPEADKAGYIPCRGELHRDPEIDAPWLHWHYDARFLTPAKYRHWHPALILNIEATNRTPPILPDEPVMLRRKLHRFGGVTDVSSRIHLPAGAIAQVADGKRYCRVCPHRNTLLQLSDIAVHDGRQMMVCPLHGLKFDPATGALL